MFGNQFECAGVDYMVGWDSTGLLNTHQSEANKTQKAECPLVMLGKSIKLKDVLFSFLELK